MVVAGAASACAGWQARAAIDFVGPYAKTHSGILVRKEGPPRIRELSDKEGLVRYMDSGGWDDDFKANFDSIKNTGMYKPTPRQADEFSCRDKVGR
ncbi:hypothetical protein ABZ622_04100 [Streptomyces sp. NPDC007164]|uniref:hypothetical protein n=1 Tax=Streptomyces sp. NPDC007164 TaxID=3156918 RepID=UPI0033FC26FF